MARPLTLRSVVVDGGHARFVRPDADNTLHTVARSPRRPPISWDIASDRPFGTIRYTGEGEVRPPSGASARDEFDELLRPAPPRASHELREALDAATQAKLVGTLEKDPVKTPDHELWPHVREWDSLARRGV